MRIPLTICGFHLQFADSTFNLRIPLTVADSATAQCNNTHVCGFHKLFWIPQIQFRIPQVCLFCSDFECYKVLCICLCNPKLQRSSKKISNSADSAKILFLACCGTRLQFTRCAVLPRNAVLNFFFIAFFSRKNCKQHCHFREKILKAP